MEHQLQDLERRTHSEALERSSREGGSRTESGRKKHLAH